MSVPHRCPVCDGSGARAKPTQSTLVPLDVCHPCSGSGVVWAPEAVGSPHWSVCACWRCVMERNVATIPVDLAHSWGGT